MLWGWCILLIMDGGKLFDRGENVSTLMGGAGLVYVGDEEWWCYYFKVG